MLLGGSNIAMGPTVGSVQRYVLVSCPEGKEESVSATPAKVCF